MVHQDMPKVLHDPHKNLPSPLDIAKLHRNRHNLKIRYILRLIHSFGLEVDK